MANQIRINGVEFPQRNAGIRSIVNNVVLYNDGTYASVQDGQVVTGQIPSDGEALNLGGMKIRVEKS